MNLKSIIRKEDRDINGGLFAVKKLKRKLVAAVNILLLFVRVAL